MNTRVDNHRCLRRFLTQDGLARLRRTSMARMLLASVSLMVALLAPFATSWHEAGVQHVRCAEHGELTHVAISRDAIATVEVNSPAASDALKAGVPGTRSGHEHCDVAFLVEGGAQAPAVRTTLRLLPPAVLATKTTAVVPSPRRAVLLASAPKTSPPTA